jgi:hypothetical protein
MGVWACDTYDTWTFAYFFSKVLEVGKSNYFPPTANEDSSEFLCDRTYQSRVHLVFRSVRDAVNAFLYAEG